jgi:hypothetical protein
MQIEKLDITYGQACRVSSSAKLHENLPSWKVELAHDIHPLVALQVISLRNGRRGHAQLRAKWSEPGRPTG